MKEHGKMRPWKIIVIILAVLIAAAAVLIVSNRFSADYDSLSETDRKMLAELDTYCGKNGGSSVWDGYCLESKPILAINGAFGAAYLVNPADEISSLFAREITMPEGSAIRVYRLSVLTPQALPMRLESGSFNTIGKEYSLFGNDVYFIKYTEKKSLEPQYSSKHFITLLSHEAFHYYMQTDWAGGGRFSGSLSDSDIDLIAEEYDVLAQIQTELGGSDPSKELLTQYARDYASVMEKRIAANPQYLSEELAMETAEGTAQYVCIRASETVGYDYGVLYFDNTKDVSFSEIIPTLRAGGIEQSFLADRMPYETGALLCELLEALQADGWQESLNSQTEASPVYLYTVISDYLSGAGA